MPLKRFLLLSTSIVLIAACGSGQSEIVEAGSAPEAAIATSEETTSTPEPEAAFIAAEPSVIKSGSFVSGEHETTGMVRLIDNGDQFVLELDETFQTSSMGPDLVVVLHQSEDVIGGTEPPAFPLQEGEYVFLAELESFSGVQRYAIPADINLDDYQSAAIWCRRFNATFGAATLQ